MLHEFVMYPFLLLASVDKAAHSKVGLHIACRHIDYYDDNDYKND